MHEATDRIQDHVAGAQNRFGHQNIVLIVIDVRSCPIGHAQTSGNQKHNNGGNVKVQLQERRKGFDTKLYMQKCKLYSKARTNDLKVFWLYQK